MTIGDRIKQKRVEMGLSQEELAKKMGYVSKSVISKFEAKGDGITTTTIEKFAKALNTTPAVLMGWSVDGDIPEFEDDHVELIALYSQLTKEQKQTVMSMLRSFVIK